MSIAPYLREIGRGKDGARALSREQAADLMARLLAGRLSDLEVGAFAIAMRIKGETPQELAGFMDAVVPGLLPLPHAGTGGAVVLPTYNGARKLPNLTALLALHLARQGVAVLVHGPLEDPGRVTTAQVLAALGLPAVDTAHDISTRWQAGLPAFIDIERLHPPLARLLALRRVIGLRNPAHTLAKLLPAVPGGVRVVNHTHAEYAVSLAEFIALTHASALLMRGTEGEPVADARRCPRLGAFRDGEPVPDLSSEVEPGSLQPLPGPPVAPDVESTAAYIGAVLDSERPLPAPIQRQVEVLVKLAATGLF